MEPATSYSPAGSSHNLAHVVTGDYGHVSVYESLSRGGAAGERARTVLQGGIYGLSEYQAANENSRGVGITDTRNQSHVYDIGTLLVMMSFYRTDLECYLTAANDNYDPVAEGHGWK